MRVAVLFSRLSGYMGACLRALKEQHQASMLVIRRPPAVEAPFEGRHFDWIDALHDRSRLSGEEMQGLVEAYEPEAILMSGWMDREYLNVARAMRKRGVPVVAGTDAQWSGSLRQQLGRRVAPWYLHSAIDVLWVAGERQRQLAMSLGYKGPRCWSGVYACDWARFAAFSAHADRQPSFLFVGRYLPVKGIDVLVEGYRRYRSMVPDPWPLVCAGAGELKGLLDGCEGIVDRGFVQPDELPALMGEASAFVLPSRREPWGVVVQEAAAAGLPLVCSDACGAAVHLLQDGYNGYLFETGNADHLASSLKRLSTAPRDTWQAMSRRSLALSEQFTPTRWAATFTEGIQMVERIPA